MLARRVTSGGWLLPAAQQQRVLSRCERSRCRLRTSDLRCTCAQHWTLRAQGTASHLSNYVRANEEITASAKVNCSRCLNAGAQISRTLFVPGSYRIRSNRSRYPLTSRDVMEQFVNGKSQTDALHVTKLGGKIRRTRQVVACNTQ